jgi:DNA-binding NarL/FixJ family response regulator
MTIRVLLADDECLIRSGIMMLLGSRPGFEVVGEAGDGGEAVALARQLVPDVVLMDLNMPGTDGVEATRQLTGDDFTADPGQTVKVITLTGVGGEEAALEALRAGSSGFLLKDTAPTELVTAIERVAAGGAYLDPAVTRGVIADIAARPSRPYPVPGDIDRLTPREREILILMAHGLDNDEIAGRLHLALATVKTHVCRVIMKLGVNGRTQAVVAAYQNHLVHPGTTVA